MKVLSIKGLIVLGLKKESIYQLVWDPELKSVYILEKDFNK